ncbi:MAG: NAD(P)/FAD-dependent oxidoreductase [Ruthenibacterium sp.]
MFDCIIVGGGPAGLSAAINLVQRGKTPLVLTGGESLLARAERVDNYLGLPALTGRAMMDTFTAHAVSLGVEIRHVKVGNIMAFGGHFMVNAGGDILECRSVILATGISKANPIPGETELLGRGVSYCATCDGMLYRGRSVAVWGIAADAAHEANFLAKIGCHVTFIAAKRPDELADDILFIQGKLSSVQGESAVTAAAVNGEFLPVTGVFILRPGTPPDALLPGLAVQNGAVSVDAGCAANLPGVFAAGDVTGAPLQVSKAVGEGLVAGQAAAVYLDGQP